VSEAPAIAVRGLTKRFGQRTVVDHVDLTVMPGRICGFLGPNGSGKTTILRMICGLLIPDAGEGEVLGLDLSTKRRAIKHQIGYMTQKFGLFSDLSIAENLEFIARVYRLDRRRERVAETLEKLGLTSRADQLAGKLSGGWKQRLALAAAVMHEPKILLLDEPTAGVDPQARREFWDQIHALAAEGMTVLVSTHYMDEAEQLCDRLVVMDAGRIVAEGSPRDLIERYSTREVLELRFPAGTNTQQAPLVEGLGDRVEVLPDRVLVYAHDGEAALVAAHERGAVPESALVRRSTLEDVFLHLTGRSLAD
jgi:ABC-2 type transport system ATP-binding protein